MKKTELINNKENYLIKNILFHILIFIFFLILSFVINKIPSNYIVTAGDGMQLFINPIENIKSTFYLWLTALSSGQGSPNISYIALPFLLFQTLLYKIGFSYSNIANAIIFIFLYSSFYSFFFSVKIINNNVNFVNRLLSSMIYSLNIFTFMVFSYYSWGYTTFLLLYIFIPLIFALFIKFLDDGFFKYFFYFSIIFFISTMGFGNIAFFGALIVAEILFIAACLVSKKFILSLRLATRIFVIFVAQLLLTSHYLIFTLTNNLKYINELSYSTILGSFSSQFVNSSVDIFKVMSLSLSQSNFPFYNLYSGLKYIFLSPLFYLFCILVALLFQNKEKIRNWINYLIFFVIFFFLLMRATPPFDKLNILIYNYIPGFKVFRGSEKLFIFLPFIYVILLSLLLYYSNLSKKVITVMLIIVLLIPFPFYIGGIPKYLMDKGVLNESVLVKIPDEYYRAKDIIDKDENQLSVISLPPVINWIRYNWNYYGIDFLGNLYNKRYISTFGNMSDLSFQAYNSLDKIDKEKFISLLQNYNCEYLLLHKDLTAEYLSNKTNITDTIKVLESDKVLKKLMENEYFNLYGLDDSHLFPMIYSQDTKIYFKKINPVSYKIYIPNLKNVTKLDFYQSFNSQWNLYLASNTDILTYEPIKNYEFSPNVIECKTDYKISSFKDFSFLFKNTDFSNNHTMIKNYANQWTIDPKVIKEKYSQNSYKINKDGSISIELIIYYKPQLYFYLELMLIFAYFMVMTTIFILNNVKNKRKAKTTSPDTN